MYKKSLLSTICLSLIIQFNTPFAYAQLPKDELQRVTQQWEQLKSQSEKVHTQIEQCEREKAGLDNIQNLNWGNSTTGDDVTWSPVYRAFSTYAGVNSC